MENKDTKLEWKIEENECRFQILQNGKIKYIDTGQTSSLDNSNNSYCHIRTQSAIPKSLSSFYFEIEVANGCEGVCSICIGLTSGEIKTEDLNSIGTAKNTIGYFGSDGKIRCYNEENHVEHTESFSEKYLAGDTVGCYLCRYKSNDVECALVQFTKNGKIIHKPTSIPNTDLYPTISLISNSAEVKTNLGEKTFLFDVKGNNSVD